LEREKGFLLLKNFIFKGSFTLANFYLSKTCNSALLGLTTLAEVTNTNVSTGKTKGGSITVPLTSCLTSLD